jgi:hypothetical protein
VNLFKKDGRRAQISSVGRKLLYEIQPRFFLNCLFFAGFTEFSYAKAKKSGDKIILRTYLALNHVNLNEDDQLENQFGLFDEILSLYSNLGTEE